MRVFLDSDNKRTAAIQNMMGNVGNFIGRATETESFKRRLTDNKRSAVQAIHVAMTQTPEKKPRKTSISLREKAKIMNIPWTTFLMLRKPGSPWDRNFWTTQYP